MAKPSRLAMVRCECGGVLEICKGPTLKGSPVVRCTECNRKFVAQPLQESYCDTGNDIPGGGAAN